MAAGAKGSSLDNTAVEAAYARWAPVYDLAFSLAMAPGRRAAVQAAEAAAARAGGPILDVGVGTGLELPYFKGDADLIGVDLSEPMLQRARQRVAGQGLRRVRGLLKMDATRLAFPDEAFGAVVAPFVMTVVPEPGRTLDELLRVTKPGGEIVLVNHVGAEAGLRARAEALLARASAHLGWRPEFPWAVIGDWISAREDATLLERRDLPPASMFTLVRIGRGSAAPARPPQGSER
jgi:phosphatidylethanolamine/phosphatidyl-N-methylethanolamine N-methyltransferase